MSIKANFTTYDRLNKPSQMSIGATDPVDTDEIQDIADALDAITIGSGVKATATEETEVDAGLAGPSANGLAERTNQWVFRTQELGGEGRILINRFGCADNSVLAGSGDKFLNLGAGVGAALKTAWDVGYKSPAGLPGVLLSVENDS